MKTMLSKIKGAFLSSALALTVTACVESAAILQPDTDVGHQASIRTISPDHGSLSDPTVTTSKTAKEYYLDLERCRAYVLSAMGGTGSDDITALRRALQKQSDSSAVVVHYDAADRAVVRDRAIRACLARKGYAVKL